MYRMIVLSLLSGMISVAANAQQQYWYYCDPAHAYFPYVSSCPAPWRKVQPNQQPDSVPAQPVPVNPALDQKCEQELRMNSWTPDCLAWKQQKDAEDAARRRKEEQEREAAQERARAQQEEAQKKYQEAVSQQVQEEKERGYEPMTIEDFQLDGKSLAAHDAKVALEGFYAKLGNVEYLMPSAMAVASLRQSGASDQGVALLTDDAARNVRKYFLECRNDVTGSLFGCHITVLGRATMCEKTTFLAKSDEACIAVDDGWNVAPP